MSILTLIPRHNSIIDQSYWYESNITLAMTCFILTMVIVLDFIVMFPKNSFVTTQFFLKNYFATFVTCITCYCTCYMIWTMILEYNHPIPNIGIIIYFPMKIVSIVSLPLMLLREFSRDEETKTKLKYFRFFQSGWITVPLLFKGLLVRNSIKLANTDALCIVALLIPIAKMSTSFVFSTMMNEIVEKDNERAS